LSDSIVIARGIVSILTRELETLRGIKGIESYIQDVLIGAGIEDIRRFIHWIRQKEIRIREGWPMGDAPEFPCWAVVSQAGSEKPDRYAAGDRIAANEIETVLTGSDGLPERADRIETFGTDWDHHFSLESWSINGELTPLLHALLKHLIFRNKDEFAEFKVFDISLSEENFIPNMEMFPNIPYVRTLSMRLDGRFDYTVRTTNIKMKHKTSFRLGGFYN
jgi:hypothetical protein